MTKIIDNIKKALDQADSLNGDLNAFLSVEREAALRRAEEIEKDGAVGQSLRGFPIAIKDNICTTGINRNW